MGFFVGLVIATTLTTVATTVVTIVCSSLKQVDGSMEKKIFKKGSFASRLDVDINELIHHLWMLFLELHSTPLESYICTSFCA